MLYTIRGKKHLNILLTILKTKKMSTEKILWTVGTVVVAVLVANFLTKQFPVLGGNTFEGEYTLGE